MRYLLMIAVDETAATERSPDEAGAEMAGYGSS